MDNLQLVHVENKTKLNKLISILFFVEPIYLSLCNAMYCANGKCMVTSSNMTYCQCPDGITGVNCDQRM